MLRILLAGNSSHNFTDGGVSNVSTDRACPARASASLSRFTAVSAYCPRSQTHHPSGLLRTPPSFPRSNPPRPPQEKPHLRPLRAHLPNHLFQFRNSPHRRILGGRSQPSVPAARDWRLWHTSDYAAH